MENVSSLLDQVNTVFLEKQQQLKQVKSGTLVFATENCFETSCILGLLFDSELPSFFAMLFPVLHPTRLLWFLLQAEATLEQEVAALAKEKEMMTKVLTADNDIIYLNVGGTFLATKRSTLTQVCCVQACFSTQCYYGAEQPLAAICFSHLTAPSNLTYNLYTCHASCVC